MLVEHQINSFTDVLGDRHAGSAIEFLQEGLLLFGDVDGGREFSTGFTSAIGARRSGSAIIQITGRFVSITEGAFAESREVSRVVSSHGPQGLEEDARPGKPYVAIGLW